MALSYRLHREEDLPELRKLWEEYTDWGLLTDDMWRKYFLEAPLGGASMMVATDDASGKIVGEFAFMPSLARVSGRDLTAFRPRAPIVAGGYRFFDVNPMNHPAIRMYTEAVAAMRQRGDGLIYMMPDPRWMRLLKMFPGLRTGTFPLYSLALPMAERLPLEPGFDSVEIELTDPRIDGLWEQFSRLHHCLIVRDSRSLPWKIGNGENLVVGVQRGRNLVALLALRAKGDRQWLVTDLLFADSGASFRAALSIAANLGHAQSLAAPPEKPIIKIAILTTPLMEATVRSLGFVRDAYDFPFVVQALDPSVSLDDIDPRHWFLSAND